jgi:hypothetical protein
MTATAVFAFMWIFVIWSAAWYYNVLLYWISSKV